MQIVDEEGSLSDPVMVPALFLSSSALDCQLPVEDVQSAGVHHPPVTRWQIKVPDKPFILREKRMLRYFCYQEVNEFVFVLLCTGFQRWLQLQQCQDIHSV